MLANFEVRWNCKSKDCEASKDYTLPEEAHGYEAELSKRLMLFFRFDKHAAAGHDDLQPCATINYRSHES